MKNRIARALICTVMLIIPVTVLVYGLQIGRCCPPRIPSHFVLNKLNIVRRSGVSFESGTESPLIPAEVRL